MNISNGWLYWLNSVLFQIIQSSSKEKKSLSRLYEKHILAELHPLRCKVRLGWLGLTRNYFQILFEVS